MFFLKKNMCFNYVVPIASTLTTLENGRLLRVSPSVVKQDLSKVTSRFGLHNWPMHQMSKTDLLLPTTLQPRPTTTLKKKKKTLKNEMNDIFADSTN